MRPMEGEQDLNTDDTNALLVNGDQNTEFIGGGKVLYAYA